MGDPDDLPQPGWLWVGGRGGQAPLTSRFAPVPPGINHLAEVPALQVMVADVGDGAMAADFAVASPQLVLLVHVRPLCRVRLVRT